VTVPYLAEPVLPAAILQGSDRFLCAPYSCVLFARACVERQALVAAGHKVRDFAKCGDCAVGRTVKERAHVDVNLERLVGREARREQSMARGVKISAAARRVEDRSSPVRRRHDDEATLPTIGATLPVRGLAQIAEEELDQADETGDVFQAPTEYREKSIPIGDGRRYSDLDGREIITSAPVQAELLTRTIGPARPQKGEEPMSTCTHPNCGKTLRLGKLRQPPPPGTETLCRRHRAEHLRAQGKPDPAAERKLQYRREWRAAKNGTAAKEAAPAELTPARRDKLLGLGRGKKAQEAKWAPGADPITLATAIEAVAIVEAIGWDTARALAERMGG
jgi:hypothetical protein